MNAPFHLHRVDSLRGIAILMVIGFHVFFLWGTSFTLERDSSGFIEFENAASVWNWLNPFRKGWAGVELFLVISGFLIHLIYLRSRDTFHLSDFFRRRFWRIYPPYLVVLVILFIWRGQDTNDLTTHLLMIHNLFDDFHFSINGSFWSIALEVQLYILYPLVVWSARRSGIRKVFVTALLMNVALTLTGMTFPELEHTFWFGTFVFKLWYVWIAGAWLAQCFYDKKPLFRNSLWVALISYVLFLISDLNFVTEHLTTMLATLAAVALMDHVLHLPAAATRFPERILAFTGKISYSLYLIHQPVLEYFRECGTGIHWLGLGLLTSGVLAFTGYHALERPSIAFGKYLITRRKSRT